MSSDPIIAVVEDDEDIRSNVCLYLGQSGFQTWGAESAEAFYVQLLRNRADLVVVDVGLPGEDGMSLVGRLAEQGVPSILMTARADLDSRIAGLNAGALQYFVKPVDMQELAAGIRSQLRRKALLQTLANQLRRGGLIAPPLDSSPPISALCSSPVANLIWWVA